jgi:hypothetical protein
LIEEMLFSAVRKHSAIPFSNIRNAVSPLDEEFTALWEHPHTMRHISFLSLHTHQPHLLTVSVSLFVPLQTWPILGPQHKGYHSPNQAPLFITAVTTA